MKNWTDSVIETVERWVKDGIWTESEAGHFCLNLANAISSEPPHSVPLQAPESPVSG